jgi:hypothetical protein
LVLDRGDCRRNLIINSKTTMTPPFPSPDKSDPSPDLGYRYLPGFYPMPSSYGALEVFLRRRATGEHFDPVQLDLAVCSSADESQHLQLSHPWSSSTSFQALSGRVIITDRNRKKVEGYTFGGELRIDSREQVTIARLTSPAPIFDLMPPHKEPSLPLLVEEVEILLAERRAAWADKPLALNARWCTVDPLKLYAACMAGLMGRLAEYPSGPPGPYRALSHLVRRLVEASQSAGDWPASVPSLEALL